MPVAPFPAPMNIRDSARRVIEDLLPWYDPIREAAHNRVTEAIRQRAIAERVKVERVIAQYEDADGRSRANVQSVIDSYRKADDRSRRGG